MAATKGTLTKAQQEQTRAAIQTTQLVKRLQGFALGESEVKPNADGEVKPIEIDRDRLKAIEILLRKSLPDLSAVTVGNEEGKPFETKETGQGAAKLAAILESIAERSRADS
ncbi:MAG: hypothetical protein ACPG4X_21900 [Pikeienuella sp.]